MPKKPQQVNLLADPFPEEAPTPAPSPIHHCTPVLTIKHTGKVTPMPRLDLPDIGDNAFVKLWRWFGDENGGGNWVYVGTVGFHYSVKQVMRPKTDIALPYDVTPYDLQPLGEG